MKKKIILVAGDPNSINSEIIFKCWKKLPKSIKKNIFLIANIKLLKKQYKVLNYNVKLVEVKNIFETKYKNKLKVLNVKLDFKNPFKVSKKSSSKFVINSLTLAHNLGLEKNVAGIINCPIDKRLLNKNKIGVTEFLATKCKIKDDSEVMIIKNKKLIVSPITTHSDIKSVSKRIKKDLILKKVITINNWYKKRFFKKPKIAILGLNPHNAELRKDAEEKKIIIPAIKNLKKNGLYADGPFVSDTIFIEKYNKYDVIVGMYHDQVLSPFKAIYKFDAINLTLGLKYFRVSPDHGIASDKVKKKISSPLSLLKCFEFFYKFNS